MLLNPNLLASADIAAANLVEFLQACHGGVVALGYLGERIAVAYRYVLAAFLLASPGLRLALRAALGLLGVDRGVLVDLYLGALGKQFVGIVGIDRVFLIYKVSDEGRGKFQGRRL